MRSDIIEQLFAKYYNELILYMLSVCRDTHLAEDIVSEAFFKALMSADDDIRNVKAWLITVCRNEYFSYCRKHKRENAELNEAIADDNEPLLDKIIKDEEYRALYRTLSLLSPDYKEALTLFYFSGMSVKEISAITDKSEDNVKVTLHRARKKLKEILEVTE